MAAIDRLVHHAVIFEMNVQSYRRRTAMDRAKPPDGTTIVPAVDVPATAGGEN